MIKVLEFVADYTGLFLGGAIVCIVIAVIARVIVKAKHGERIDITPVGIANDLPDSVTGMNKYDDALITEEKDDKI